MTTGTSEWAARALAHVDQTSAGGPLDRSLRVTLSFHPDRVVAGATVVQWLAREGVYRSQFETGTSNGGLTAHPGGDRWRWEQRLFGHHVLLPGLGLRAHRDGRLEELRPLPPRGVLRRA